MPKSGLQPASAFSPSLSAKVHDSLKGRPAPVAQVSVTKALEALEEAADAAFDLGFRLELGDLPLHAGITVG
jgi:hypothetical protein